MLSTSCVSSKAVIPVPQTFNDIKPEQFIEVSPLPSTDFGLDALTQNVEISTEESVTLSEFFKILFIEKKTNYVFTDGYNPHKPAASAVPPSLKPLPSPVLQPQGSAIPLAPTSQFSTPETIISPSSPDTSDKLLISSLNHKGSLSLLLKILMLSTNHFFIYEDSVLYVRKYSSFSFKLMPFNNIHEQLIKDLKNIGCLDVSYNSVTHSITFVSDFFAYRKAVNYLNDLVKNQSYVTLHLSVYMFSSENSEALGFDFNNLALSLSRSGLDVSITKNSDASFSLSFGSGRFGITSLIDFLNKHGSVELKQNISIGLLGSYEGKLESVTEYPYVSAVTLTQSEKASQPMQAVQFDKVDSGIILNVKTLQRDDKLFLDLDLVYRFVQKYISLSTGMSGVVVQRPQVVRSSFKSSSLLKNDSLLVLGGILTENNDISTSSFFNFFSTQKTSSSSKSSLFVTVRPQITRFKFTD
jgi:hypothetical protein